MRILKAGRFWGTHRTPVPFLLFGTFKNSPHSGQRRFLSQNFVVRTGNAESIPAFWHLVLRRIAHCRTRLEESEDALQKGSSARIFCHSSRLIE